VNQPYAAAPYRPNPQEGLSQEDVKQLELLPMLFYIYAGFVGVIGLVVSMFAILPAIFIPAAAHGDENAWVFGGMFLAIFGCASLFLWAKAVVMVLAGRAFGRRSNHMLCMVGACVALMNIPLGTALGIFAITVLQRPQVKATFSS
jgi:hypothetical protein